MPPKKKKTQKTVVDTSKKQKVVKKDKGATQTVIVNVSKGGGRKRQPRQTAPAVAHPSYVVSQPVPQSSGFSNISELIKLLKPQSVASLKPESKEMGTQINPIVEVRERAIQTKPRTREFSTQFSPEHREFSTQFSPEHREFSTQFSPEHREFSTQFSPDETQSLRALGHSEFGTQYDAPAVIDFGTQYTPELFHQHTQTSHFIEPKVALLEPKVALLELPVEPTPFAQNFNDAEMLNQQLVVYRPPEVPERKMISSMDITELDAFHPVAGVDFSYEDFPNYRKIGEEQANPLLSSGYKEKAKERVERFAMGKEDERAKQRLNEEWEEFQKQYTSLSPEEQEAEYEKGKIFPEPSRRGGVRPGAGRPENIPHLTDIFDGVALDGLLAGDYGYTESGKMRANPTKKQKQAIDKYKKYFPKGEIQK